MARDILAWKSRPDSVPPPLLAYRSSRWGILGTVCVAIFTDILLYGIIVPVVPFALSSRAGVADGDVQYWVSVLLAIYAAALVAASPICGWFADRSESRRMPLLSGLLALAGATLMLCLGRSIALLIIGRALQGISAAVVWTVGLTLLVDTVGQREIAESMGYVSLSVSLAILIAPLLGGVIYDRGGYYAVFYLSFGMIALDIILRLLLIEKKTARQWTVDDEPPAEVIVTNMSLEEGNQASHTDRSAFVGSEVQIPPGVEEEATAASSVLQPSIKRFIPPVLTLLSSRRLLSALWCSLAQSILMTSWDATLPLRVAKLFGWDSLGAGLIFLPFVLPSFSGPFVGMYVDRKGPRLPAALGFFLSIPPVVLLRLVDHSGIRQIVLLSALLALLGFTLTMAMVPFLAEISYVVMAKEKARPGTFGKKGAYAQAYGIYNCAFSGGMVLGPIWGGFLVGSAGWGTMTWSLAVISAVSVVPAALWTGGWIGPGNWKGERVEATAAFAGTATTDAAAAAAAAAADATVTTTTTEVPNCEKEAKPDDEQTGGIVHSNMF